MALYVLNSADTLKLNKNLKATQVEVKDRVMQYLFHANDRLKAKINAMAKKVHIIIPVKLLPCQLLF